MNAPVSPAGSAQGWSFKVWLAKNKRYVKAVLIALAAWLTVIATSVQAPELSALLVGAVGLAAKLALDWIDFFCTEVELPR